MAAKLLHILKNRSNRRVNLLLFLIPPLVFALIVAAVVGAYQRQNIKTLEQVSVLGK
jgi:hypothetical protein